MTLNSVPMAICPIAGLWSARAPKASTTGTVVAQRPTASRIAQTTQNNALSSGQSPCAPNYPGWIRVVIKIVTDQHQPQGDDIVAGGQSLTETVTLTTPNALNVSGVKTNVTVTNAAGQFDDTLFVCSALCPQSTGTATASQTIHDVFNGGTYNLSPNTFVYSCTGNTVNGQ
jgi:hypothetical protein